MSKKFEVKKLDIPNKVLRTPECIDCFDKIREHTNVVMSMFEIHADELFDNFTRTSKISMTAMESKSHELMIEHFDKQELKEDKAVSEHLEKQSLKYDEFEKKVLGLIWKVLSFVLGIILLSSSIVAITWIMVQEKADKKEVLNLSDAKNLLDMNKKYNDDRYVINPNQTVDQQNYEWLVETIFERATRSGKDKPK